MASDRSIDRISLLLQLSSPAKWQPNLVELHGVSARKEASPDLAPLRFYFPVCQREEEISDTSSTMRIKYQSRHDAQPFSFIPDLMTLLSLLGESVGVLKSSFVPTAHNCRSVH